MAGDLATMKARIATEIARADLTTQIADAITTAITEYQAERFRFSETNPAAPPTFSTIVGQSIYGASTLPTIGNMLAFDYLTYVQGNSTFKIYRKDPEHIKLANQNGQVQGPPDEFCYEGESIVLYPVPDNIYPISISGHFLIPAPAADDTAGNRWMLDGELMIRSRAKFEIATHVTRNAVMAAAMTPDPDVRPMGAAYRAFRKLKGETNRLTGTGTVKAMKF